MKLSSKNKAKLKKDTKTAWFWSFRHFLFYLGQFAKDMVTIIVTMLVAHQFSDYEFTVQLNRQYLRTNEILVQFITVVGGILTAATIIWAIRTIYHNTLHYPKYIYYAQKKADRKTKYSQFAEKVDEQAYEHHIAKIKKRQAKRASKKLDK